MKNSISDKVLNKIDREKIKPTAKWEFIARDSLIWLFAFLSVLIGSLAVSVVIFLITGSVQLEVQASGLKRLLCLIPYFWLLILAIFLVLAYLNFQYTKKGYKLNPYLVIVISILLSIILGSVAYAAGLGEKIEEVFYRRIPVYQKIMHQSMRPLSDPQKGFLVGTVACTNDQGFLLYDFQRQKWQILLPEQSYKLLPKLPIGMRLLIKGQQLEEFIFQAEMLKPLLQPKHDLDMMIERNNILPRIN